MKIVTIETISIYTIIHTLGTVIGNTIRARHIGNHISAMLRLIVGGEIKEHTGMLAESREKSI